MRIVLIALALAIGTGGALAAEFNCAQVRLITPYPPGVPAVVPGEELNDAVIAYLRSGADAGMTLPDPSDPQMHHFRVVA